MSVRPYRNRLCKSEIIDLEHVFSLLCSLKNPCFCERQFTICTELYSSELQLNKANTSNTEAPFLDLHLSISNGFVSSKIYHKRDAIDFDIVNFPFLDGDVPRRPSYGVYISQLIRFARVCSHVDDFNTRNKCLTAKLLKQGYRYHKFRKAFSKFYHRYYELISKFNVGLRSLLHQGLSEPEFYGDLVYKFKKIRGMTDFSHQFRKIIMRYKRIGYNLNVMRQSACLVINPITVDGYATLFNCMPVYRASDSVAWSTGAQLIIFFCFRFSVVLFDRPGISIRNATHCIYRVLVFASS